MNGVEYQRPRPQSLIAAIDPVAQLAGVDCDELRSELFEQTVIELSALLPKYVVPGVQDWGHGG